MKCIDAIEGLAKSILNNMHSVCIGEGLDDSEYVRNAKAVIDGTKAFALNNPELAEDPGLLEHVLYVHSRSLWLAAQQPAGAEQAVKTKAVDEENEEYQTYYYDYLYHRGLYPR